MWVVSLSITRVIRQDFCILSTSEVFRIGLRICFRDKLSVNETAGRTSLARNTIKKSPRVS